MNHDYAAGGVVYRYDSRGALNIVLIKDRYGHWTLPKGHLDPNETEEQAALREIAEETGVTGTLITLINRIDYQVVKKGELRDKTVAFFLVRADTVDLRMPDDGEILAVEWSVPDEALGRIKFQQIRDVLQQGLALLPGESG